MGLVRVSVAGDDGRLAMIVIPDRDEELDDPAFQPVDCRAVDMDRSAYDGLTITGSMPAEAAILALVEPIIAADDARLGQVVAARIAALNAQAAQAGTEAEAEGQVDGSP